VSGGRLLGVALTAATSGNIVNVISGRGILLNAYVSGTAATAGSMLEARADGNLALAANNGNATAICLADGTAAVNHKKVMLL
jgi:predicted RecA/RadA family phage recombinase